MRCFVHEDRESIGVCVACGRGVCRECLSEEGGAVSCRNRCEGSAAREVLTRDLAIHDADDKQRAEGSKRIQNAIYGVIMLIIGLGIALISIGRPEGLVCAGVFVVIGSAILILGVPDKSRRTFRACPKCGYNLTGATTPGCPECGWKLSELVQR